jgi:hypothetical protein
MNEFLRPAELYGFRPDKVCIYSQMLLRYFDLLLFTHINRFTSAYDNGGEVKMNIDFC